MKRCHFERIVRKTTHCSDNASEQVVTNMLESMADDLKKGEAITVRGFGTLKVIDRKERVGRNIKTGETVIVPARKDIKFVPSKELLEQIG